jgi:uncharacterized membrane protein YgdD (TMEM256/DUF423 family)
MAMPRLSRILIIIGGVSLSIAFMLSAYGLHGLEGVLPPEKMRSWNWANQLQVYNSLGLVVLGILATHLRSKLLPWIGGLIVLALFLFSGSIYVTCLGAPAIIGEVAPLGGSSFMLAWLLVAFVAWRARDSR